MPRIHTPKAVKNVVKAKPKMAFGVVISSGKPTRIRVGRMMAIEPRTGSQPVHQATPTTHNRTLTIPAAKPTPNA